MQSPRRRKFFEANLSCLPPPLEHSAATTEHLLQQSDNLLNPKGVNDLASSQQIRPHCVILDMDPDRAFIKPEYAYMETIQYKSEVAREYSGCRRAVIRRKPESDAEKISSSDNGSETATDGASHNGSNTQAVAHSTTYLKLAQELKDQIHEDVMRDSVAELLIFQESRHGPTRKISKAVLEYLIDRCYVYTGLCLTLPAMRVVTVLDVSECFWAYTDVFRPLDDPVAFDEISANFLRHHHFESICSTAEEIGTAWDQYVELNRLLDSLDTPELLLPRGFFHLEVAKYDQDQTTTLNAVVSFYVKATKHWNAAGRPRGRTFLTRIHLPRYLNSHNQASHDEDTHSTEVKIPSLRKLWSLMSRMEDVPANLLRNLSFALKLWRMMV